MVWRPGFCLKLVHHHVTPGHQFLPAGQKAVVPGWERVFQVSFGKFGIPHPFIDRHAVFIRSRCADWPTDGVIAAGYDDFMMRIEPFDETIFTDEPLAVMVGAYTKPHQKELIFHLVTIQGRRIFVAVDCLGHKLFQLWLPDIFRHVFCPLRHVALRPSRLAKPQAQGDF